MADGVLVIDSSDPNDHERQAAAHSEPPRRRNIWNNLQVNDLKDVFYGAYKDVQGTLLLNQ